MKTDLKVLHVIGGLRRSGLEEMLLSAQPYFVKHGVANEVVARWHTDSATLSRFRSHGIRVFFFPRGIFLELIKFLKLVRRYDLHHIHAERHYLLVVLAIKFAKPDAKILRTVHSVFSPSGLSRVRRNWQSKVADHFVSYLMGPSGAVIENERDFGRKLHFVSNWISDRYTSSRSESEFGIEKLHAKTALLVGNCSANKNHEFVIPLAVNAGWKIIHIGDESQATPAEQDLFSKFQSELKRLGHSDPFPWLAKAQVLLMPSKVEGMGMALAEGASMGLTCLASDISGFMWARDLPNVMLLPLEPEPWRMALSNVSGPLLHGEHSDSSSTFSARRGAFVLTKIYVQVRGER